MIRHPHLAVLGLFIPSMVVVLASAGEPSSAPSSTTTQSVTAATPDQHESCRLRIEELELQIATLQHIDTTNGLLGRLLTQPQIWEGTILSREDQRGTITIQIAPEDPPAIGMMTFELSENPGDLTVGDEVRVRARLHNIGNRNFRSQYGRYRYQLTEAQLLSKRRPINSTE